MVNSGAFTLTVIGTNFVSGSIVNFGGQQRATTFVSATQLTAAIQAGDLATPGQVDVFVVNPAPGGGDSTVQHIHSGRLRRRRFPSLSPSSVVAGGPAFTLTVNGLNFLNGATVNFNSTPQSTTFVSTTQLTIAISAADIASQGTINISVTNPSDDRRCNVSKLAADGPSDKYAAGGWRPYSRQHDCRRCGFHAYADGNWFYGELRRDV